MSTHPPDRNRIHAPGIRDFFLKPLLRNVLGAVLLAGLVACTHIPTRPAASTLGCAQAVLRDRVPQGLGDKALHCVAAGLIALHCSRAEANLVAIGKETADLFGPGDADRADWRAGRTGVQCAGAAEYDIELMTCCEGIP